MEKDLNVCVTCLSSDRDLVSLHKIKHFLKDIKFVEVKNYNAAICWECKSIIMKFYKFKKKALRAQTTLNTNVQMKNGKSLSYLQIKVNKCYDYEYCYFDPLNSCDIETKVENDDYFDPLNSCDNETKEENDDYFDPLNSCDNETKVEINIKDEINERVDYTNDSTDTNDVHVKTMTKVENVNADAINTNENELKRNNSNIKEIEQKFIEIVFTEEEMIKNREDKRNHYNFKKTPYKCDSCVLGFMNKENYEVHLVKKHDELIGPLVCDVCQVRYTTESALASHRRKHYISYKCKLCKYATTEQWSAWKHCKLKHDRDKLNSIHCGQCAAVFKTPSELEEHTQTSHTIHCSECGVRFKGKGTLRSHKARIHAVKREFVCDICTKTFKNKTRLESHMVSHNSNIARKLSYCHVCKVQYKNIRVYRNHIKNNANHSEKPFSCPECNKKFASKLYWTQHYKFYHLRKSQYKCDVCDKLFISDWRLKNHKQVHHGLSRPRNHHCNICGKKFFTIANLRNHKLTHSDQRSYMCEDCGDTFKQRPALYTHTKLVHGDGRKK